MSSTVIEVTCTQGNMEIPLYLSNLFLLCFKADRQGCPCVRTLLCLRL